MESTPSRRASQLANVSASPFEGGARCLRYTGLLLLCPLWSGCHSELTKEIEAISASVLDGQGRDAGVRANKSERLTTASDGEAESKGDPAKKTITMTPATTVITSGTQSSGAGDEQAVEAVDGGVCGSAVACADSAMSQNTGPIEMGPPMEVEAGTIAAMAPAVAPSSSENVQIVETMSVVTLADAGARVLSPEAGVKLDAGAGGGSGFDAASPERLNCLDDEVMGPSGECYYLSSEALNWEMAGSACRMRESQAELASITSEAEHDFIATLLVDQTWIGASDSVLRDVWRWSAESQHFWQGGADGAPVNEAYARWYLGEPSGGVSNEDCARYFFDVEWYWADTACANTYYYLCERTP